MQLTKGVDIGSRRKAVMLAMTLPILVLSACGPWGSTPGDDGAESENREELGLGETLVPVWQTGSVEGEEMYFSTVMSVDFDDAGSTYVLDYRDQVVSKLGPDGKLIQQFGVPGQGPGELAKSRSLAWADGRVLVANEGNGRIEVFTDQGETLDPVRLDAVPAPAYVFARGQHFYVGKQFVPEGHFLYRYSRDWSEPVPLKPAFLMEDRLDFLRSRQLPCPASDGGFWLVFMLLDKIEKIDAQGETMVEASRNLDWDFPRDERGVVIPEILVTRYCATDLDGNLYVVYSNPEDWKRGNDVYKFAPDGQLLGKAFTLPIHRATAIAFDPQGAFYYSDGITLFKAQIEEG